jgi:hypothetical protein
MAKSEKSLLAAPGFSEEDLREAEQKLRQAGFRDIRIERRLAGREIACLMARR